MNQEDHWNYITGNIEKLFNEEFLFVKEHTKQMHQEGRLMFPQDDQSSLEITKDNLIFAIENLFEHHLFKIKEKGTLV